MKSDKINELKEKYSSTILSILHSNNQESNAIQRSNNLDRKLMRVLDEEKRRNSDGKTIKENLR